MKKYYKIYYWGRNSYGCNSYNSHLAFCVGGDEREGIENLKLKTRDADHQIMDILDLTEVGVKEYNGGLVEEEKKKTLVVNQKCWKSYLCS